MVRTYSELISTPHFQDRFNYLKLDGVVGDETFGYQRYVNQSFYRSTEWKEVRDYVISRDYGRDLAVPGREIYDMVLVHHMNPITNQDILNRNPDILDPEFLVCVSHDTHNAIHYGDRTKLVPVVLERTPGDTKLW